MRHLTPRCLLAAILPFSMLTQGVIASAKSPGTSPPPLSLLQGHSPIALLADGAVGQMDDPDLVRELAEEETLVDLQNIEFSRESLSVSRGVLLSLVPGGGWSLIYGNRKAQGLLMILGATAGYGMGLAYLAGFFDEEAERRCLLTDSSKASIFVGLEYCNPASPVDPTNASAITPARDRYLVKNDQEMDSTKQIILRADRPLDELSSEGYRVPFYSEVKDLYKEQRRGSDYDGTKTGQLILLSTYAVTTIVSAVWATVEIREQNNELRKKIESTAQAPNTQQGAPALVSDVHPTFNHDGQQSIMGLSGHF